MLKRSFGRTVSRNLAEFMCDSSTLRTVEIDGGESVPISFHEDFFSFLAEKGNKSAVNNHTFQSCSIIMAILIITLMIISPLFNHSNIGLNDNANLNQHKL